MALITKVYAETAGLEDREGSQLDRWIREYKKGLLPEVKLTLAAAGFIFKTFSFFTGKDTASLVHRFESSTVAPLRGMSLLLRLISTIGAYSIPQLEKEMGFTPHCENSPRQPVTTTRAFKLGDKENVLECDVAVIGSGAGGAAAAYELASLGFDVAVLEAGEDWMTGEDFASKAPWEVMCELYQYNGIVTTSGNNFVLLPTGKGVGGTTTVNSGTCFRPPAHVMYHWRVPYGMNAFKEEEIENMLDEIESDLSVAPVKMRNLGVNGMVVRRGAEALGLKFKSLRRNARGCLGCGRCAFGCPEDAKQSMNISYVPMAAGRGARVYTGIRVERFCFKNERVEYAEATVSERGGRKRMVKVRARFYVLAAGALNTPGILKRSGVKHRSLGKNLTIHPATRVLALMHERVEGWRGVPQGGYIDDFAHEGIMLEGIFAPPCAAAINLPYAGKQLRERMREEYHHLSAFGVMVSERDSIGSVWHTRSGRPLIFYQMGWKDLQNALKGIKTLARLYFEAGAERVYLPIRGFQILNSPDEMKRLDEARIRIPDVEFGAFHPKGTAFAAGKYIDAPLGPDGRVRGVKNLVVADTSFMPTSLGVNPQITCMAFARLFARRMVEQ